MRLLSVIGIVTLYVTVNTNGLPAPASTVKTWLSNDKRDQSQQFVSNLARNFSSFYFDRMTEYVGKNRIVSSLSAFIPMSLLSYGARGETRKNFLDVIRLPKHKARMAENGYKIMLQSLAKYDIRLETKMLVPTGVRLNPEFIDLSTKVFNTEIEYADTTDVTDKQKNPTELIEPQPTGRALSFSLNNTIRFKGIWKKAFDKFFTTLRPFHAFGDDDPVMVPTMYTTGRFKHGRIDEISASFVELPYESNSEDDAMSMFILLPDEVEGDDWVYMISNLRNITLSRLLNSTEKEVAVTLPKFNIETELSLNEFLNRISSFSGPSNFSGIFDADAQFDLGESVTKIVIEVDEEGEEAAASSGISYYDSTVLATLDSKTRSAAREVTEFNVDRPFAALIITKGNIFMDIFCINYPGSEYPPYGMII
ncbi:antitrypsin-like [Venturia canescens]|uniref:antitrypsin-like n=1 Tax=Venturia canescens TaxID=32260 RepID=UPI001C9C3FD0|nr:antitrypsin-like [Venturia canescens]